MPIRPATVEDLDDICALVDDLAAYEHLEHDVVYQRADMAEHLFGPEPAAHVLLAVADDGTVAGMALWFRTFSTFLGVPGIWLEDLFVCTEQRGRGYGTALMRHLRSMTSGRVEWAVLDWNTPSVEFYDRLGAHPVPGWTRYRWLR
jgi:GNAT superfamily N-acetyltransferase